MDRLAGARDGWSRPGSPALVRVGRLWGVAVVCAVLASCCDTIRAEGVIQA